MSPTESYPERPIQDRDQDVLERQPFVERLAKTLVDEATNKATGVTIGLTGSWGSGKSSILNLLRKQLETHESKPIVVSFDPWMVAGRTDLISEFLRELLASIRERVPEKKSHLESVSRGIASYAERLSPLFEEIPFGKSVAGGAKLLHHYFNRNSESLAKIRGTLIAALQDFPHPVVALIDEVDRVEDDEIRTIAQLVRSVVDFPGISYVLAYDAVRVAQALGHGSSRRGAAYLEKIVQFQIPLPLMFAEERARMLEAELRRLSSEIALPAGFGDLPRFQDRISQIVRELIATPRDIKRLLGTYQALGGMVAGEVDWLDLLGYCVILTKHPEIAERIRNNVERVVSNPLSMVEMVKRSEFKEDRTERAKLILGNKPRQDLARLVTSLFPSLGSATGGLDYADPICERRPLLTVLRLGLIPGAWGRERIEEQFNKLPEEVAKRLREMLNDNTLSQFLDRVQELYGELHAHAQNFWSGVSEFLRKDDGGWLARYVPRSNLTKDLADLLTRVSRNNPSAAQISVEIFDKLESSGDIHLVTQWLRDHMFEYGLFGLNARRNGRAFMSADQSKIAVGRVLSRWKKDHLEHRFLNHLFDLSPIYAIVQAELWDEQCKLSLNELLENPDALDAFTLLAFGPEYQADGKFLRRICDVEMYRLLLRARLNRGDFAKADESLRSALRRAEEALNEEVERGGVL
jgi:hypothetical protein